MGLQREAILWGNVTRFHCDMQTYRQNNEMPLLVGNQCKLCIIQNVCPSAAMIPLCVCVSVFCVRVCLCVCVQLSLFLQFTLSTYYLVSFRIHLFLKNGLLALCSCGEAYS